MKCYPNSNEKRGKPLQVGRTPEGLSDFKYAPRVVDDADGDVLSRQLDLASNFERFEPGEQKPASISDAITQGTNVKIESNDQTQIHGVADEDMDENVDEKEDEEEDEREWGN